MRMMRFVLAVGVAVALVSTPALARAMSPVAIGFTPPAERETTAPTPELPAELVRLAERELAATGLEDFAGGHNEITLTTLLIVLIVLLVIVILL